MVEIKLTQASIEKLIMLAYDAWVRSWDNLKEVKQERNDGSKDWLEFHADRLAHSIDYEKKAQCVLSEIRTYTKMDRY